MLKHVADRFQCCISCFTKVFCPGLRGFRNFKSLPRNLKGPSAVTTPHRPDCKLHFVFPPGTKMAVKGSPYVCYIPSERQCWLWRKWCCLRWSRRCTVASIHTEEVGKSMMVTYLDKRPKITKFRVESLCNGISHAYRIRTCIRPQIDTKVQQQSACAHGEVRRSKQSRTYWPHLAHEIRIARCAVYMTTPSLLHEIEKSARLEENILQRLTLRSSRGQ
jgi:hypothetical protein